MTIRVGVVSALVLIGSACGGGDVTVMHASFFGASSVDQLMAGSDAVVVGEAGNVVHTFSRPSGSTMRVVQVTVDEVIYGDLSPGEIIEVEFFDRSPDGSPVTIGGMPRPETNDSLLLFLLDAEERSAAGSQFWPTNPQGLVVLNDLGRPDGRLDLFAPFGVETGEAVLTPGEVDSLVKDLSDIARAITSGELTPPPLVPEPSAPEMAASEYVVAATATTPTGSMAALFYAEGDEQICFFGASERATQAQLEDAAAMANCLGTETMRLLSAGDRFAPVVLDPPGLVAGFAPVDSIAASIESTSGVSEGTVEVVKAAGTEASVFVLPFDSRWLDEGVTIALESVDGAVREIGLP